MPTYTVVASKDGSIRLLTRDQMDEREEKRSRMTSGDRKSTASQAAESEKELGTFTAENSQEARRMFVTLNPSVDLTDAGMKLVVQTSQQPEADETQKKLQDLHQSAIEQALGELKIPEGGDPATYSDEAHVERGEMMTREERDALKDDEKQPRGQDVASSRLSRNAADRNEGGRFGSQLGNTGKAEGQTSSRSEQVPGGAGVVDAGSPNAGTAGPSTSGAGGGGGTGNTTGAGGPVNTQGGGGRGGSGSGGAKK